MISAQKDQASPRPPPATRQIDSQALLDGAREVLIAHGDECYRLLLTRQGKLILTK